MPEVWFPHLGIRIHTLNRVAFSIFGFSIYWYGILIGSGVLLGIFLAMKNAEKTGQNPDDYLDFTVIALFICIAGARLYYVLFNWQWYQEDLLAIFNLRQGGLAIYGGVLAGVITAYVFTKRRGIPFGLFLDTAAPSLLVGQILGRFGNFFNREAFGDYTDSLFAMRYLKEQVDSQILTENILNHEVIASNVSYIQVHPTFLYEAVWNLGLLLLIVIIGKKFYKFYGELAAIYFLVYGIGRFWMEGLRTDQLRVGQTGIAASQALSAVLVILAVLFICYKVIQMKKKPAE